MSDTLESYRPAARAIALIGREKILKQIKTAVTEQTDATIFYIEGDGGLGKTRLVNEVLRVCRDGEWTARGLDVLAANEPVDLYHTQTHVLEGLIRALGAVMPPSVQSGFFKDYAAQLATLERRKPDLRYALREIADLRNHMIEAFLGGFHAMTRRQRVVMAFDTAEVLHYETDAVQQKLQLPAEGLSARRWLIDELLPQVQNAVILIAGRPRPELLQSLQEKCPTNLQLIKMDPFDEQETLQYFTEVMIATDADRDHEAAERIAHISEESRRVIHLLTGGRPILLSLTIDLLANARRLPDDLKISLADAQRLAPDELNNIRKKLEASIVSQFLQFGSVTDEAIRTLAFAHKGLDAEMLAQAADMPESDVRQVLGALTGLDFGDTKRPAPIEGLRKMSFIKVRPADSRVFLHDEMYAMMEQHVITKLPEPQVQAVYRSILDYYEEELERNRQEIESLGPTNREEITSDLTVVTVPRPALSAEQQSQRAKAEIYRNYMQAEHLHYLLRFNALEGFKAYRYYAEEAYESADEDLDLQLREELLTYVNAPERKNLEEIDGLRRSEVDFDAGICWIKYYIRQKSDYQKAIEIDRDLPDKCSQLMTDSGPFGEARLNVWGGLAHGYFGELNQGEQLLRLAIKALRTDRSAEEFHAWQRTFELASAYNSLGFVLVKRGLHRQAVDVYKRALPLWRKLGKDFGMSHANTLNNLAWALAEVGEFDDASRQCQDGLELRLAQVSHYPIALSYNTQGMIQTRNDQPHRAYANCGHALAIFRELEAPRGIGMASSALAEACRRMGSVEGIYFPEEQAAKMRLAVQYARAAVEIFGPYEVWPDKLRDAPQVAEPSRLVDALIELGCAYRDWAKIWPSYKRDEYDPERSDLARSGELALREAAENARAQQPHRAVDALVNLAWLKYYIDDLAGVDDVLSEAQSMVNPQDLITPQEGVPQHESDQPWHWVQLGKIHLLKGHIAFNKYFKAYHRFKEAGKRDGDTAGLLAEAHLALEQSAAMYTLSVAYDDLYGQTFRDLKRGEARIYDRLKGLNVEELQIVRDSVLATAREHQLDKPHFQTLLDNWFGIVEEE